MTEGQAHELGSLAETNRKLLEFLEKGGGRRKDFWDKIASVSAFLSSVVIAALGAYFTHTYQMQQDERSAALRDQELRILRVQTLEQFIPYLKGAEEEKRAAIIAISALGDVELATKFASLSPSPGTLAALSDLSRSKNQGVEALAMTAVEAAKANLDSGPEVYRYTYTFEGRSCEGSFSKRRDGGWLESTSREGGCLETAYLFRELGRDQSWILLHDAGRGYFVRLPLAGAGWAQLATSEAGPWGNIHEISLVSQKQ